MAGMVIAKYTVSTVTMITPVTASMIPVPICNRPPVTFSNWVGSEMKASALRVRLFRSSDPPRTPASQVNHSWLGMAVTNAIASSASVATWADTAGTITVPTNAAAKSRTSARATTATHLGTPRRRAVCRRGSTAMARKKAIPR